MNIRFLRYIRSFQHFVKSNTILAVIITISIITILSFNAIECWIFPPDTTVDRNAKIDTLKFLGYAIGGLLLIWQIVLTNKRTNLVEKGQIQERFKNAIDQLGSDKEAVNLGAIYTLHHIAKESAVLRKTVFDILCSYIRETTSSWDNKNKFETENGVEYFDKQYTPIKIQSILNLLFVDVQERSIYNKYQANLSLAHLIGANLNRANLKGANLTNAVLRKTNLENANLDEANLSLSDLTGARLENSSLNQSRLVMTNLIATFLDNANLKGVLLAKARVNSIDWIIKLKEKNCVGSEEIERKYYITEENENDKITYIVKEKN